MVIVLIIFISNNPLTNIHHTDHMEPYSKPSIQADIAFTQVSTTLTLTIATVVTYNIRILVTIITVTDILILPECRSALTGLNRDPFITT